MVSLCFPLVTAVSLDHLRSPERQSTACTALDNLWRSPQWLRLQHLRYTTKLASNGSYDQARKSIKRSLESCGLDRIDLYLLHSPYGGSKARLESWRAVEDAIEAGEVRTGGVSNFGVKHVRSGRAISLQSCLTCFSFKNS